MPYLLTFGPVKASLYDMNSVLILLNSLNDWKPYCETDSLVTVTDYLEHRYGERKPKLVINLSDDYGYNSEGYYCSLLARASRPSTSSNRAPESA